MHPLSEKELDQLFDYFNSEIRPETCLDFFGLHGMLTADVIAPIKLNQQEYWNKIYDGPTDFSDPEQQAHYTALVIRLRNQIEFELVDDAQIALPFDPQDSEASEDREAWCAGFMDMLFDHQDQWFQGREEDVATLLMPIETGSGLFDDEDDFKELLQDRHLTSSVLAQIPEILVDLYLLIQVPDKKRN